MAKHKPLAADVFLAKTKGGYLTNKKTLEYTKDVLRTSKRFVFDVEASRYVGEMIKAVPKAVLAAQEFAIQPFKRMYVEFEAQALWKAINPEEFMTPDADGKIGFIYDDGRVFVIAGLWKSAEDPKDIAVLLPLSYRLFKPMTFAEETNFCDFIGMSRLGIDMFYWGSTYNVLDNEERKSLRRNHGVRMEFSDEASDEYKRITMQTLFKESLGDLRNIIAMLLFLNRTSNTRIEDHVPVRHTMIGTKPSALLSHSVVHFKLNPVPRLYESWGTGTAWRREHDVRGHFCHNKEARDGPCRHDWTEYDVNRWRCLKCAGLKWWRKEHKRGHKDKGRMTTTYEVHK
jgi:hypothetical protein